MRIRNLWKKIKCRNYEFNSILIKYDPLLGYYIELIKETFKKNAKYKSTFLYLFHSKILTYYSTHSSLHSTVLVSNFKFHESNQGLSHICTAETCWPALTADLAEKSDSTRPLIWTVLGLHWFFRLLRPARWGYHHHHDIYSNHHNNDCDVVSYNKMHHPNDFFLQ